MGPKCHHLYLIQERQRGVWDRRGEDLVMGGAGDQGAGKQSGRDVAISQGMPGTTEAGRGQEWILSWSP